MLISKFAYCSSDDSSVGKTRFCLFIHSFTHQRFTVDLLCPKVCSEFWGWSREQDRPSSCMPAAYTLTGEVDKWMKKWTRTFLKFTYIMKKTKAIFCDRAVGKWSYLSWWAFLSWDCEQERAGSMVVGENHVLGRRKSRCKGPVVEMRCACTKKGNVQGECDGVKVKEGKRCVKGEILWGEGTALPFPMNQWHVWTGPALPVRTRDKVPGVSFVENLGSRQRKG